MKCVQNHVKESSDALLFNGRAIVAPEKHVSLIKQFLTVLPHILPAGNLERPALLHLDLHPGNIFVDDADPTKITGILDWQAAYAAPLFLQARFPSVFDYDGSYTWGAVRPRLPDDFDNLPPAEKDFAQELFAAEKLKKLYELGSRKFNPDMTRAMDAMRNESDPTTFIFLLLGQTSVDGPMPLRELLIQTYRKWEHIIAKRGLAVACPLRFTEEEIRVSREEAEAWAEPFTQFSRLRDSILGKDGWVSHEDYDEAQEQFKNQKDELKRLWKKVNGVAAKFS